MLKLDSKDRAILRVLQEDATLTIQEVGDRVGLSANPCWRRIRQLEASGVIERRVAIVNARAVGLSLTAFVSIRTAVHSAQWLESFAAAVRAIPEIVECHRMSGDVDYLLKILVADMEHYDRVYRKLIAGVSNLSDVSSAFSMEPLKAASVIEIPAS
jgi:Lrp/AsnC family transcriptional regulator